MIRVTDNKGFILETGSTSYIFRILPTGQPEHLYYGRKITIPEGAEEGTLDALTEKHAFYPGNTTGYDQEHLMYSLEDMRLEMSAYGKGDIREPFICIGHVDGSTTSDFVYEGYEIKDGTLDLGDMPASYDEGNKAKTLTVILKDRSYDLTLYLNYVVYEDCDVITRNAGLVNNSRNKIILERLMSMQMDFDRAGYVFTTFRGAWAREMQRDDCLVTGGKHIASSMTGTSSNRCNPFFMLHPLETSEDSGEVYGFNLVYSGNHYECVEAGAFGKTRVVSGINPEGFKFLLGEGDSFHTPEAVMTYSACGYNGMSKNMHRFVREHIVRGEWKHKTRPVLLNSWEAAYFDINEHKLTKLAKAGKEVGIELFVMDDGWFGERDND